MTSVSGEVLLDALEDAQAVAVGQLEIEQHQIELRTELLQRFAGGPGLENAVAFFLEPLAQRPPDQRLVVNDQHRGGRHAVKYTNEAHPCQ